MWRVKWNFNSMSNLLARSNLCSKGTPRYGILTVGCHENMRQFIKGGNTVRCPNSSTQVQVAAPRKKGNTCLEDGSYLMNYVGCAKCHQRDFVLISNKATEDEDGEEIVTYDHVCKNCDHIIARHEYTFSVVDDYQEYTMLCLLCGKAEDSISVLPDDPRQSAPLF